MHEDLVLRTVEAIPEPQRWHRVLETIIAATGAKAAMITLRDAGNCQIVNDDALEREFHSPLVCGFPQEAIRFYLEELRTIDPWAEAQITHYPSRPLQMSSVCPPDDYPDQRFFSWLRPAGINDTIAFELDRMPGHWTACNIFLDAALPDAAERALAFAQEHYRFLRKAWQSGQQLVHSRQSNRAALDHMAQLEIAACIAGPSGELIGANSAFDGFLAKGWVGVTGPRRRLSIPRSALLFGEAPWLEQVLSDDLGEGPALSVSASSFTPDPLYAEKRKKWWFLTFREQRAIAASPDAFAVLTERERQMLEAVREGANVSMAGAAIGVGRSRAFEIWASVKDKLGITNAHQLR